MTEKNHFSGEKYAENFNAVGNLLPGSQIHWLNDLRKSAIEKFIEVGLPGPKVEEWKYSNLTILNSETYEVPTSKTGKGQVIASLYKESFLKDIDGTAVVFVDGYYSDDLSQANDQNGVRVQSLNEFIKKEPEKAKTILSAKTEKNSLKDLNTAFMTDGTVLIVEENIKLAKPIQIIHISSDHSVQKTIQARNVIQIEKNAEAAIVETFIGLDGIRNWLHNVTDINVEENATLEIYQFQREGTESVCTSFTSVRIDGNATFKHLSLNIGGKLSRTEIKPTLNGINGNVELRGAFLARENVSHDVFTHMKHMVPECNSNQIYRGVLDKGGKSAFQGKVYVAKDAQLTNADQSNKNLLLDRNAEANSKPELLIYADDVKCSHGATVGELDDNALFYLKSRGLDHKSAKSLLVEAFVAEVFEEITLEPVREKYLNLARNWLNEGE